MHVVIENEIEMRWLHHAGNDRKIQSTITRSSVNYISKASSNSIEGRLSGVRPNQNGHGVGIVAVQQIEWQEDFIDSPTVLATTYKQNHPLHPASHKKSNTP
jgi:hypothetical protein